MRRQILAFIIGFALALCAIPSSTEALPNANPCVMVNLHPNQSSLPNATVGQPYSVNLWVTPNNPCIPIIWTVSPPLPASLALTSTSPNSAVIAGIPLTAGSYTFTVTAQATYICGTVCFVSQTYTLLVL